MTDSVVSDNRGGNGGGISAEGPMAIANSTISGNTAEGDGGGIFVKSDVATLRNTTIAENIADGYGDGV